MSGTVFVLGAGASYGDRLQVHEGKEVSNEPLPNPPLTNHFFRPEYLATGRLAQMRKRYKWLLAYIQDHWGIEQALGQNHPSWNSLSIEEVFTSVALLNDFSPATSDERAYSQILLNSLSAYIREIVGFSTVFRFGIYTRALARQLRPEDTVLSFNYDLLMDQELMEEEGALQYQNFSTQFLNEDIIHVGGSYEPVRQRLRRTLFPGSWGGRTGSQDGLYLKLHGSLNWFACSNSSCPKSGTLVIGPDTSQCLGSAALGIKFQCGYCRSDLDPFLVPPLVQKPVMADARLRNIWGNALAALSNAERIVVIGFSFQPSDFYASWLFRRALQDRTDVKVWIVNPDNRDSKFQGRMSSIFPRGYDRSYFQFEQISDVIKAF